MTFVVTLYIINDKDFTINKKIKFDEIIGVDFENSVLFVKQKNSHNAFSMIDGSLLSSLAVSSNVHCHWVVQ